MKRKYITKEYLQYKEYFVYVDRPEKLYNQGGDRTHDSLFGSVILPNILPNELPGREVLP